MSIAAIVGEVSSLAEQITDMPIYWRSRQTREGVEGMLQAARAFGAASDGSPDFLVEVCMLTYSQRTD